MSGYVSYANIHNFLDQINYILIQTNFAKPEIQYYDSTHLNLLAEAHPMFANPDPA